MGIRTMLLTCLIGLVALTGAATAQENACPECDGADDSWYSSIDAGFVDEEATALADTDASLGESKDVGDFAWLSICLQFLQILGENIVATVDVFASEEGVDVDGSVSVADESIDLDEDVIGDLDGQTWEALDGSDVDLPVDHEDLGDGVDLDLCLTDLDVASAC